MRERRRHKMIVTRNREYHFRNDECVGVRDRKTGRWVRRHLALRANLVGFLDRRHRIWKSPIQNGRLQLISRRGCVLTSPLIDIFRPDKNDILQYTSLCKAGMIR